MDGCKHGQTDGQTDGWVLNRWKDRCIDA